MVGNPANTNALIAMKNAPQLKPEQFSAMTRLDHNRALSQIAQKTESKVADVKNVVIWGNHSSTQVPDLNHAEVNSKAATELVSDDWVTDTFIPTVQKRGAAIIEARGASSAASAASAAVDHMRSWSHGTPEGEWVSMGIMSKGDYGVAEDIMYSFPVTISEQGEVSIVKGLDISSDIQKRMKASEAELLEEREAVKHLF